MIVDFQHHFTPRELFKEDLGDRRVLQCDATGAPSYTSHALLYDLDEHDDPQEIRAREAVRDFVREIRTLGEAGQRILSGNVGLLLKDRRARSPRREP